MFDHLIYNICLEIYFYQEEDDESESGKYIHISRLSFIVNFPEFQKTRRSPAEAI